MLSFIDEYLFMAFATEIILQFYKYIYSQDKF